MRLLGLYACAFVLFWGMGCTGEIGDGGNGPNGPSIGDPSDPGFIPDGPGTSGPRPGRRLSASQLRAALIGATGFDYVGRERVTDPSAPQGSIVLDDAPLLDVYAPSLGEADYNYVVQAAIEPSITFSKIAEDGVRFVCERVASAELTGEGHPSGQPHLLFAADGSEGPDDGKIAENIAHLAMLYWGHRQSADDPETQAILPLYRAGWESWEASEEGGDEMRERASLGWRTVCIGMLSDPRFMTY